MVRLTSTTTPALYSGTVEERGGDRPTIVDPGCDARLAELRTRDPAFDASAFVARVRLVFDGLQRSWSSHSLEHVRAFVGDNLFEGLAAQIDQQTAASVRNVTENARVLRVDLANVLSDAYFDAITTRVFATGLDYTLDARGSVVAGSRTRERPYTEYWTFLRARGRSAPTRTDPVCPNCGAPLRVNAAGHCEYCRAKITTGEFDWVLSRIEQDDAYSG
jgi:predicted lipid-binding transport protein (Tim44 family)